MLLLFSALLLLFVTFSSNTLIRQLCGTGSWEFDRTIDFRTPSDVGIYDVLISQGSDVICKHSDDEDGTNGDKQLLASVFVRPPGSVENTNLVDDDELLLTSCDTLKCPSICHVVPKKYIPNKSVYHMTYRNLAIGTAVGAGITFALSSHFLKTAVTFSSPWTPPPPSLANTWLGSASVTVGASLLAQYWLSSTCHGELLNWGAGFSSVGALSCLFMIGFQIHNRCFKNKQNNIKKQKKKKNRNRTSSIDGVNSSSSAGSSNEDRTAGLIENESSPSVESGITREGDDSETDTDDDNAGDNETATNGHRRGRRRRRQRGTWIVQVGSAYVRIVSGLESLPGVPDEVDCVGVDDSDETSTATTAASREHGEYGGEVVPDSIKVVSSDVMVVDGEVEYSRPGVTGGGTVRSVINKPPPMQAAPCHVPPSQHVTAAAAEDNSFDDASHVPVASAVAIFA